MKPLDNRHPRGFTLIEVLIAVVILTFIAVFCTQSIQNSIRFKTKFQSNIDQQAKLKIAMQIMERDINLAFHHRDIIGELYAQVKKESEATPTPPPGAPPGTPPPAPALNATGETKPETTQFLGEGAKMDFTTRSNVRMFTDAPESDQAKVGYTLKPCPSHKTENQEASKTETGNCLWRRISPILDDDVTKGGVEQVLLTNVKTFKLRYFGEGKQDWVEQWKTTESDEYTKNRFPLAVEVVLTTEVNLNEKSTREASLETVASVRFPNNVPLKKAKDAVAK